MFRTDKIPKDVEQNKRYRIKLLNRCRTNAELRAAIMKKCKEDNVFWCNSFAWTLDPRKTPSNIPFILYPKQKRIFKELDRALEFSRENIDNFINIYIDKPRGVGATVTVMNWILHKMLFDDNFNALIGSRKEDYVDKTGNPDTLFYKIDYTLDRLPKWMLQGYNEKYNRSSMSIRNPVNNNTIDGESSNPNFGRGGRRSVIVMDELGFWETAESAWSSCGQTTNFRLAMSTPPDDGRDSFIYKLLTGKKGKVETIEMDWQDVPGRDEKWLASVKENESEETFAREVMKSFDGTVEGKVYANDMKLVRIEKCDYNTKLPLFCAWDDGLDGTALIWIQKDFQTNHLFVIDCYQNFNKDISFYAPFFGYPITSTYDYNDYDLEVIERHKYWKRDIIHYGDPSIKQTRNNTGESCRDVLQRKFNIWIECKDWNNRKWKDLRDLTKPLFRRMTINPETCENFIYAMRNARYVKPKEGSNAVQSAQKPIHDSTSHLRSAFEYFADNEPADYFMAEAVEVREDFDPYSIF